VIAISLLLLTLKKNLNLNSKCNLNVIEVSLYNLGLDAFLIGTTITLQQLHFKKQCNQLHEDKGKIA